MAELFRAGFHASIIAERERGKGRICHFKAHNVQVAGLVKQGALHCKRDDFFFNQTATVAEE